MRSGTSVAPEHKVVTCSGCRRSAASLGSLPAAELAGLLSWERFDYGWWCVMCQWKKGRLPRFARRAALASFRTGA